MALHPDFSDLLAEFARCGVEYLVVGGHAVGFYGVPRFTKDLGIWIGPEPDNMERAIEALDAFGAPQVMLQGLRSATSDDVAWMGIPPLRIDILKGVPGGDFAAAYSRRLEARWDGSLVCMIALEDLVAIKRASGRPQDIADVEMLERAAAR
jgi:hypothetical protein